MAEKLPELELTPGALLRRSRKRYGWSVEDVADELKLLPYVVDAIEQDDYSQMAGWTYAVGYLRGYGKLVGVNVENAIAIHASLLPQKENGPGTLTQRSTARVAIPISLSWVITAIVVIIVVGGISATYWKRAGDSDNARVVLDSALTKEVLKSSTPVLNEAAIDDVVLDSSKTSEVPLDTLGVSGEEEVATEQVASVEELAVPKETVPDVTSSGSGVVVDSLGRAISLSDIDTRIIGTVRAIPGPVLGSEGEVETTVVSPSGDGRASIPSPSEPPSGTMNPREIILFVDENSWIDIRDVRDRELLRDNVRAGTTVRLEGEPPFTVFVGNAQGVRYLYRDEERPVRTTGEELFGRFKVGSLE